MNDLLEKHADAIKLRCATIRAAANAGIWQRHIVNAVELFHTCLAGAEDGKQQVAEAAARVGAKLHKHHSLREEVLAIVLRSIK